jgi:hypothetical protein
VTIDDDERVQTLNGAAEIVHAREEAKKARSFEPIERLDMSDPSVRALWLAFGVWLATADKK